ncbi:hypothetical protein GQ457_03G030370 [Hibiscus cannabinus]
MIRSLSMYLKDSSSKIYTLLQKNSKIRKELIGAGGFRKVYRGILPTSKVEDAVERFKVIEGVASRLFCLHQRCDQVVIHKNVKASNVLLDDKLNGRLGDFEFVRLCNHRIEPQTTRVSML